MIIQVVDIGIDLTEFYQSVEWDILSVPAQRWSNDELKGGYFSNNNLAQNGNFECVLGDGKWVSLDKH